MKDGEINGIAKANVAMQKNLCLLRAAATLNQIIPVPFCSSWLNPVYISKN